MIIWVDSFSDCFTGGGVEAVVEVLTAAGYAPQFLDRTACCGLTWISTGQLEGARRQLRAEPGRAAPARGRGHADRRAGAVLHRRLAQRCRRTAARRSAGGRGRAPGSSRWPSCWRRTADWQPPDLSGVEIVAQPHCHHASVLGWQADAALLNATGATVTTVGGCCGLAGNFGVEKGHYDVSVKVAEHDLLPAVARPPERDRAGRRLLLPDPAGRAGRPPAITLAELLARPTAPDR